MPEAVPAAVRTGPRRTVAAVTTHALALAEVDRAIRAVGGAVEEGVIHVSLLPWKDGAR